MKSRPGSRVHYRTLLLQLAALGFQHTAERDQPWLGGAECGGGLFRLFGKRLSALIIKKVAELTIQNALTVLGNRAASNRSVTPCRVPSFA